MRAEHLRTHVVRVVVPVVLTALSGAALVVATTPAPATAAVRASTGQACTLVGTKGRDVLKGTRGRDVICGRGGNDVIKGRGGNDVVDGGSGKDRIVGGKGDDLLVGGTGSDLVDGGTGNDRLAGEAGNDQVLGGTGSDRVAGGADTDQVSGGTGDDRLDGGSGNDVVTGSDGRDTATGGSGNDVLVGGNGDDQLGGGTGADRVSGGQGNDRGSGETGGDVVVGDTGDDQLSGGPGSDAVDGGAGFNLCDTPGDPGDRQVRCAIDTAKPVVRGASLSRTTVDVSSAAQTIQVRAHVTDDTGIRSVQIGPSLASLVSGNLRDGIWASTVRVPRYIQPGPRDLMVDATDRVGRGSYGEYRGAYTVTNSVYDRAMPVVRSLSLSASRIDVRTAEKSITATARITDDLAGAETVYLCPSHAFATQTPNFRQAGACAPMDRVSGSARDSLWRGTLDIPRGAQGGTWNTDVWVDDAAGNLPTDFWYGPDSYAAQRALGFSEGREKALPNGAGRFQVVGSDPDTNAPELTSLRISPSPVDTSRGAVSVTADISGTDVEGITDAGLFISGYPDGSDDFDHVQVAWVTEFRRISGTAQNGVWRATFTVPGGTPNGTYWIQAVLQDRTHWESWVSPGSGWTTDNHVLTDALAPTGTTFTVVNTD